MDYNKQIIDQLSKLTDTTMKNLSLEELQQWADDLAQIRVTEENRKIALARFEVDYLIRVKSLQGANLG